MSTQMNNKSLTAEDVFYKYERNRMFYSNCHEMGKLACCPTKFGNKCYCWTEEVVNPTTIGYTISSPTLGVKTYIAFNEKCPICLSGITHKSNAYLTECGHSFHRKCMYKAFVACWGRQYLAPFKCPICRDCIGVPAIELKYNSTNFLDELENYEQCKEYYSHFTCDNGYNHKIGFKKDCKSCLKYRKTGHTTTLF